jgi:hypothetical protein
MKSTGQEEAEHVLPCSDPGESVFSVAVEINDIEFTGYLVSVAPAL